MNMGKCYFQNSPCCSRFVALALDEERLHLLVIQDLHGRLLGSVALRDREVRLLRLRHHRTREVILVDGVVFGRHGPVQQWHDVAKHARRVGVAEIDGGGRYTPKEVELDGLDRLFLLADDVERRSLNEQIEKLRTSLKGLSPQDQAIIARQGVYEAEQRIIQSLERDATSAKQALTTAAAEFKRLPTLITRGTPRRTASFCRKRMAI